MRGFTILTLLCLMSMSNTTEIKSGDYPDPLCDYPSSCQNCVEQIENIIVYCVDHIMPTPECVGAIIYASQYCHQCLCEIIEAEMSPDLAPSLCPACPDLDICPSTESKTSLLSLIGKYLANWSTLRNPGCVLVMMSGLIFINSAWKPKVFDVHILNIV